MGLRNDLALDFKAKCQPRVFLTDFVYSIGGKTRTDHSFDFYIFNTKRYKRKSTRIHVFKKRIVFPQRSLTLCLIQKAHG